MSFQREISVVTLITVLLLVIYPSLIHSIQTDTDQSAFQSLNTPNERDISPRITSIQGRVSIDDTILPKTNLTISQYITGQGQVNTFSTSLLSLNNTHWFTRSDYANTSSITSPFDSIIDRDSINHTYPTSDYWNWEEQPNQPFDFWIDPTGFVQDYIYSVYIQGYGYRDATIVGLDNITMSGVGTFEAWNITIDFPGFPNFAFYEKDTGMVLCTYLEFVGDIWYNLTQAEIATLPGGYAGPILDSFSPVNQSTHTSGSLISVSASSPFGVYQVEYNWDEGTVIIEESASFQTSLPGNDGEHSLFITATDNIGYTLSHLLVYTTDNTLPGIILNDPSNNSRIQGFKQINFTIISGDGNFTYNWDSSFVNESFQMVSDNALVSVPSPEVETTRTLQIFIQSNITQGEWISGYYEFTIDNTAPDLTVYNFINNSVLKGDVAITFSSSETARVLYTLNDNLYPIFILDSDTNTTLLFDNLDNGTYTLEINLEDEAGNSRITVLEFSIYSSSFNWNWDLEAEETHSNDFRDELGKLWFSFSIVSKTDQSYNISFHSSSESPLLTSQMQFGIHLLCEVPEDIIFFSLVYHLEEPLVDVNQSFPVMQWAIWDEQQQEWSAIDTIYNQVLHAWSSTVTGYYQYFALVDPEESTRLKAVEVGGGAIPSFELPLVLLTIISIYGMKKTRKRNRCK